MKFHYAVLAIILTAPAATHAANKTWICGNGFWDNPSCWGPAGEPASGDSISLIANDAINRTVTYRPTAGLSYNDMTIDSLGSGLIIFNQNDLYNIRTGITLVGFAGQGAVTHSNGTHTTNNLQLGGVDPSSNGSYTLSGNAGLTATIETIGLAGTGMFTQSGGSHTVNGLMTLGSDIGSSGNYTQSGGSLTTINETIGRAGTGDVVQSGGTHNILGNLLVGQFAPGIGNYTLGNGSLTTNAEIVGVSGKGEFIQSGGTHSVGSDLQIGLDTTGSGTYYLNGGTLDVTGNITTGLGHSQINIAGGALTVGGGSVTVNDFIVGAGGAHTIATGDTVTADAESIGDYGIGNITQTGGSNTTNTVFYVGKGSPGNGTYTLDNGDLTVGVVEHIGSTGTGAFVQNGGTHTTPNQLIGVFGGSGNYTHNGGLLDVDSQILGDQIGSTGALTINGGNVYSVSTSVGNEGAGTVNHTAGVFEHKAKFGPPALDLVLGVASSGIGTYNLSGTGNLSVDHNVIVGDNGSGTFNQSGGTHAIAGDLTIAANAGSSGTYNMNGGSLTATNLVNNGNFEFTGGSVTAATTNNGYFHADAAGALTLTGNYTNNPGAITKVTGSPCLPAPCFGTVINFTGSVTNGGTWNSDPVETRFGNLNNSSTGVMTGVTGDQFTIFGDFTNNSEQAISWDTDGVILAFEGSGVHGFSLAGEDRGNNGAGFQDNFAWGELLLGSGAGLNLWDGNAGNIGTALYIGLFTLEDGISQLSSINSAFNIFYDMSLDGNAYLQGADFALDGGGLLIAASSTIVPVPAAVWLFGSGLLGLIGIARRKKAV